MKPRYTNPGLISEEVMTEDVKTEDNLQFFGWKEKTVDNLQLKKKETGRLKTTFSFSDDTLQVFRPVKINFKLKFLIHDLIQASLT